MAQYKRAVPVQREARLGKVFRTGVRPALTYGTEVIGMTDSELTALRREYGRYVKPHHGGISASAKLVLGLDPAAKQALAPALQWARMVWAAVVKPDTALVTLDVLCSWWTQALSARECAYGSLQNELPGNPPRNVHFHYF